MLKNLFLLIIIFIIGLFVWNFLFTDSPENYEKYGNAQVQQIVNNPHEMNGKIVTVTGKVTESMNIGFSLFKLDDGTGVIGVKSSDAAPQEGKTVQVTGVVHQYLKVGDNQMISIQADPTNFQSLGYIIELIDNEIPIMCWGSKNKVLNWLRGTE